MDFFLEPSLAPYYHRYIGEVDVEQFLTVETPMKSISGLMGCVGGLILILAASTSVKADLIAWTENGSIFRANLDGSDKQEIFQASSSAGAVTSLAYDSVTGTLYTYGRSDPNSVNDGYGFVRSMNLNGSNITTLIDSGLGTITYGVAVSDALNRMYIGGHMAMWYANLNGSGLTQLPLNPYYDGTIRIDEGAGKIYYRDDVIYQGIRSANLDGSGLQNVYQGPVSGFQLDLQDNKIFLLSAAGVIETNLDGTSPQVLVPNISGSLVELDLDRSAGKMFWMTSEGIFDANLDGSNVQQILTVGPLATIGKDDMIIIPTSAVPEPSTLLTVPLGALAMICYGYSRRSRNRD